ncbi:GNAT family N-acetyltransferase [Nocardioides sp. YIM 152588]|uniref:GNAT family N-acetyltransferase n=1 Tax=Nocardioides sp. YIM 152588 TaxID=3158259 RepID=UPI0032E46506
MDTVTTRRARASDAGRLAEIAAASYLPYVERLGGTRPPPMVADYAAAVAEDLVWVAEVAGDRAGFVVVVDQPTTTLLKNVAVHPDWQGRGIGRLLIAIAEERARATGRGVVELYTNVVMVENIRLYARLGYAEVGRRTEHGFTRVFFEKVVRLA